MVVLLGVAFNETDTECLGAGEDSFFSGRIFAIVSPAHRKGRSTAISLRFSLQLRFSSHYDSRYRSEGTRREVAAI